MPPLRLGNIGSYSGAIAASLAGGDRVAQLWAKWVNANGCINGQKVVMYTADDQASTSTLLQKTQEMVERDHVIAFVGNQSPISQQSAKSYLEGKHVPVIGGESEPSVWHQSPVFFPSGATPTQDTLGETKFIAESLGKGTKIGISWCYESVVCQALHDGTVDGAKRQGLNVVYEQQESLGAPTPTLQNNCLGAQRAGVKVYLIYVDAATFDRQARACGQVGYFPTYGATASVLAAPIAQNTSVHSLIAAQAFFPWPATGGAAKEYSDAIKAYDPDLINQTSTTSAWTGMKLFQKAVERSSGSGPITSDRLFQGLWTLKNETLGGIATPMTFVKNQPAPIVEPGCTFDLRLEGGEWKAPRGLACIPY